MIERADKGDLIKKRDGYGQTAFLLIDFEFKYETKWNVFETRENKKDMVGQMKGNLYRRNRKETCR